MLKILAIMFVGIALGYLVRKVQGVERVSSTTMLTIVLLLFVMGCEIGSNPHIVENITSLGLEALLLAVAATLWLCRPIARVAARGRCRYVGALCADVAGGYRHW